VEVAKDNRNINHMVLETLVRNALINMDRITLQNGTEITLGRDWGREMFVPYGNKGKGKGKSSTKRQVPATQEPSQSGQLTNHEENTQNARTEGSPEDITPAENERRRLERDKEEEEVIQPVPNPPGEEEVREEVPLNDIETDQEVEITTEIDQPEKIGLNFPPINPENLEEEISLKHYLPLLTSTTIRKQNRDEEERKLWIADIPAEFPLLPNSMEGERTGNHIVSIHHELRAHGYVLVRGDIAHCSPLGNQARGPSKMPIVITYKDKETKQNVTQAAKVAGL
jgi:hypothetical protein